MFSFGKRKKLEKTVEEYINLTEELIASNEKKDSEIQRLRDTILSMEVEIENFKKETSSKEHNYVKLVVSDDLQTITPFVGYRGDCFEKLFQEGMLTDAQEGSTHAIQLALMMIASEGLSQLLEEFEEARFEG